MNKTYIIINDNKFEEVTKDKFEEVKKYFDKKMLVVKSKNVPLFFYYTNVKEKEVYSVDFVIETLTYYYYKDFKNKFTKLMEEKGED